MKIRVLSDLHLEFGPWEAPRVDGTDVVVLAGDIYAGIKGVSWARSQFGNLPVVYVPGNHEFYGEDLDEHLLALKNKGKQCDVHVLDGDEFIVNGVRFLGVTCWTDYLLFGDGPAFLRALFSAQQSMADFKAIAKSGRAFKPSDALALHRRAVAFLEQSLARRFKGSTVVVTHHAPSEQSVREMYKGNSLNPSFASDLRRFMGSDVPLWIHGHMHNNLDYVECDTRVVCNPRGYFPQELNPEFNPTLLVEV